MSDHYSVAFQIIDSVVQRHSLEDHPPSLLHHYTSVHVALSVLENKDLWFCHAEYLNDASEIQGAIRLIAARIDGLRRRAQFHREHQFYDDVEHNFDSQRRLYEAFVFCMAAIDTPPPPARPQTQDQLNMWRAYGHNGEGVCLSFRSRDWTGFSRTGGAVRLSKVVYDLITQETIIDQILDEGYIQYGLMSNAQSAIQATVAALIFMVPVMKDEAFKQEREWRAIFLPEIGDASLSKRKFFVRSSLAVPYYRFTDIESNINNVPNIAEIMVGPSRHKDLNARSLDYRRGRATMRISAIPYRG